MERIQNGCLIILATVYSETTWKLIRIPAGESDKMSSFIKQFQS